RGGGPNVDVQLGTKYGDEPGTGKSCGCLDAAAVRAASLKRAARHCILHLHPHLAGFGWWVSVPIDQNSSALRAHLISWASLPRPGIPPPSFTSHSAGGAVVRGDRHSPHALPARAISSLDPLGVV